MLKLRPCITGPATLKYRLEDEYLANARALAYSLLLTEYDVSKEKLERISDQELAVWYNDNVIPRQGTAELLLLSALFVCEGHPDDPLYGAGEEEGVCGGENIKAQDERFIALMDVISFL